MKKHIRFILLYSVSVAYGATGQSLCGSYNYLSTPDDHPNTPTLAQPYENGTVPGDIELLEDIDFIAFCTKPNGAHTIDLSLGTLPDADLRVYDADTYQLLYENSTAITGGSTLSYTWPGASLAKTLYIEVRGFARLETGTYTLTLTAPTPTDSDGDGMPNTWETNNGLSPASSFGVHGADGDMDGDGATNYEEFLAGTGANDANSVLAITEILINGSDAHITWPVVESGFYELQRTPELIPLEFTTMFTLPATNTAPFTYIDPDAGTQNRYYYRVKLIQ